ncbi:hypothetical protein ACEWY4_023498 [Coilia grayii]|uniref:MADF domain-containing protein n=1 Tax=Coilia grayii TaxID=363190 RepID=A0ABD1J5R9_9TELE
MDQQKKTVFFSWTELLLRVTLDYKTQKALENIDWDSCVTKYGDILQRFLVEYPLATARQDKDFPHKVEEISKSALTTKLKAIRSKYRQAVDSGRKSGHGRVVLLFFDACEKIWGGSPSTTTLNSGVETADLADVETADCMVSNPPPPDATDSQEVTHDDGTSQPSRRDRLAAHLSTYKSDRLKRKLTSEEHLAAIAQEEILQQMGDSEREFSVTLGRLTDNIERFTASVAEGFALMRQAMYPPPPPNYSQYHLNQFGHTSMSPRTQNPPSSSQQPEFCISQYYEEE